MSKAIIFIKENFSLVTLSSIFLFVLMNPVFKKYDYGAEFPMVIVFSVLLFAFALAEWRKLKEGVFWEKLFLLIFMGAMIISFNYSQAKNVGFSEVLAFLSVSVFYLIFAYQEIPWKKTFLKVVNIGVFLAVLLGFIVYLTKPEVRMFGPFFNIFYHANEWPNALALFLLLTWPIVLFTETKNSYKIVFLALVFSALLLTYSRGAIIAFCGQVFLILLYFWRNINKKTILQTLLVLVLTGVLFFGANFIRSFNFKVIDVEQRATFGNQQSLTSKQERVDFWQGAIQLIKEKPLFGYGPFSFRYAYNPIQKTLLGSSDHPHNIFLKIGAENGLIALGAFLAFLFVGLGTVIKRAKYLDKNDRALVFMLGVSLAGAFAHDLIDYNFNFLVNLLLLFVFMAFMRSTVVMKENFVPRKPLFVTFLALWIAVVAFDEGMLWTLSKVDNEAFLENSRYPRNYFLQQADKEIKDGLFSKALISLDKEIKLNPLDGQAFYLKGVIYCHEKNVNSDLLLCTENFRKALQLNPLNELSYYRDYLRALSNLPGKNQNEDLTSLIVESKKLLITYTVYVQNNVHFTAYTPNVEAAGELIDLLIPYLTAEEVREFKQMKEKMISKAMQLRTLKTY